VYERATRSHGVSESASQLDVEFLSGGVVVAGTIYRPASSTASVPGACVVMGHGFTLTRRDGVPDYAWRFASAGLTVLSFDYRHWGDSAGEPRRWVSVTQQLEDWRAAVAHARTLDEVDPERVGVWGMSMGGGHALITAAEDSRVAAVVALVPATDALATQPPARVGLRMIGRAAREALTRREVRMPAVGPAGAFAVVTAPEALPGFERLGAASGWQNDVNTSWLLTAARYRAVRRAAKIRAPVLLQLGERDGMAAAAAIEQTAARAPHATLLRYDIDHFECFWPEHIDRVASDEINFFRRALASAPLATPFP
jgi:dienelactone hydrolase